VWLRGHLAAAQLDGRTRGDEELRRHSKQCKPNVDMSSWYGYAGACPMGGTNSRPYYFELHALPVERLSGLTPESSIREVNAAIAANRVAMATLIGMAAPNSP
jgi:phosphatidylethanolamine-binding protein (PEBP) family uncharacterized protein